jgi:hypothetical protein
MLLQFQPLEVAVADKRQGKYETDRNKIKPQNLIEAYLTTFPRRGMAGVCSNEDKCPM